MINPDCGALGRLFLVGFGGAGFAGWGGQSWTGNGDAAGNQANYERRAGGSGDGPRSDTFHETLVSLDLE